MNGITWEQFLREITIIHNISQELDDKWTLIHAVSANTFVAYSPAK